MDLWTNGLMGRRQVRAPGLQAWSFSWSDLLGLGPIAFDEGGFTGLDWPLLSRGNGLTGGAK